MKHEIEVTGDQLSAESGHTVYGYRAECTCGVVMTCEIYDAVDQLIEEHMAEALLGGNNANV